MGQLVIVLKMVLNVAFEDIDAMHIEEVGESVVSYILDALGAEVAYISTQEERFVKVADVWTQVEASEEDIERWHERARVELEGPEGEH